MNAKRYIDQMVRGIRDRDSDALSKIFNIRYKAFKNIYFNNDSQGYFANIFDNPSDPVSAWYETVHFHLVARNNILDNKMLDGFENQNRSFKALVDLIKDAKDENWQLPVLFSTSIDLRLLAYGCDERKESANTNDGQQKPDEYAEKTAESLMQCFRNLCTDMRAESQVSKRWGMMHLANQLFKIYFKINKINLCTPLNRTIENSNLKDLFPPSHQITYKFYMGRQAMFENNYNTAASYFEYAFTHCPRSYIKNKKIILVYLIPVNMLRGIMPKEELLVKYDLKPFSELVKAVKQGNILKFNQDMIKYEDFFIQNGVYLFMEKLKMTTYRNLFKKVASILKTAQIPIEAFVSILEYLEEEDADTDVCQCILSNLIYEGKIKAYISYKHNKLVINKDFKMAFPRLSTIS